MNSHRIPAKERLLEMFSQMALIRTFEDRLYQLFLQGLVPGTLHQSQGQEAVAVGVCAALRQSDVVFSTHRPMAHAVAKGVTLECIAGELWGKATGCVGGKGGQMHLADTSVGFMPSNAVVGANIPIAVGAALGFSIRGLDQVAVSFFGDGAANTGAFHEGLNFAAIRSAPVIFACENNQYAASTHISLAMKVEDIARRADAYGMPGEIVGGMDVLAVLEAAQEAVHRARSGHGPTLLEFKTYRYMGHSRGDPGNYRQQEELDEWRKRDPLPHFRRLLLNDFLVREEELQFIEGRVQDQVSAAISAAQSAPEPLVEDGLSHVFAERRS